VLKAVLNASLPSLLGSRRGKGILMSLLRYYGLPGKIALLARFYAQFVKQGDLCFDLGAHVGDRIRAFSKLGTCVVAVEPDPVCAALLNGWYGEHPEVTLLEMAVGRKRGARLLHISKRNPTLNTLSTEWMRDIQRSRQFRGIEWDTTIEVNVTTLDDLIGEYGPPRFCKIDVEGYELEVLEALSSAIPALSFEYNPAVPEIALGCISRLTALGEYEFNWTVREIPRFRSRAWLDPGSMGDKLRVLPLGARTGDVYARLASGTWPTTRDG
jgi:FkbM family methyltransferase